MNPTRTQNAFSRLDVVLIVAALAGIILVILPQVARNNARSARLGCTNNLKQVGLAFRIWAGDNEDKFPMQVAITNDGAMELAEQGSAYAVFLVMSNELNTPKILLCPNESNSKRVLANFFGPILPPGSPAGSIPFTPTNNISYFVGLDTDITRPNTILVGDDNFSVDASFPKAGLLFLNTNNSVAWTKQRHVRQGNLGMSDGSVYGFTTPGFRAALIKTGIITNRLAMP